MPFTASEALPLLLKAHSHQRLAHAHLISGPEHSGKRTLTLRLCSHLLNTEESKVLSHPDVHPIAPESRARFIRVEQMRALENHIHQRSSLGGAKVAILFDADRMYPAASNAFLKTLEEPPPGTHLFLLSAHPEQLLETIRSRCLEIPLRLTHRPDRTAPEKALLELLTRFFSEKKPSLSAALWLANQIQALLASTKEDLQERLQSEAKSETDRYKESVDSRWLEQQEDALKARVESAYLAERNRLLELLEAFWADVLRFQNGLESRHLPECSASVERAAASLSETGAHRRLLSITQMRRWLGRSGVSEALALEYGLSESLSPESL